MHMNYQPKQRDRRRDIRGKLKTALDLMIWGDEDRKALPWNEAARTANFNVRAMRKALERPHVREYLRQARRCFMDTLSAQTPARLAALRDQDDNRNAAVAAARTLEEIGAAEDTLSRGVQQTPGFSIVIVAP